MTRAWIRIRFFSFRRKLEKGGIVLHPSRWINDAAYSSVCIYTLSLDIGSMVPWMQ